MECPIWGLATVALGREGQTSPRTEIGAEAPEQVHAYGDKPITPLPSPCLSPGTRADQTPTGPPTAA